MSHLFVDAALTGATPGSNVVWASGTPHHRVCVMDSTAFATLAAAYAVVPPGGVLYVASGVYQTPTLMKSLAVVGIDLTAQIGWKAKPYGMVISGERVEVQVRKCSVRALAGATACALVHNGARAAFSGCKFETTEEDKASRLEVSVRAQDDGAAVCLGCEGIGPEAGPRGAVASFPPPVVPRGGGAAQQPGRYNLRATLEAPAEYRGDSGNKKRVWIPAGEFYCRYDPARDGDSLVNRVVIHGSTGILFCRGGVPVTNECRVRVRGRKFEVVGVAALDGITNEFAVGVVDVNPGED